MTTPAPVKTPVRAAARTEASPPASSAERLRPRADWRPETPKLTREELRRIVVEVLG